MHRHDDSWALLPFKRKVPWSSEKRTTQRYVFSCSMSSLWNCRSASRPPSTPQNPYGKPTNTRILLPYPTPTHQRSITTMRHQNRKWRLLWTLILGTPHIGANITVTLFLVPITTPLPPSLQVFQSATQCMMTQKCSSVCNTLYDLRCEASYQPPPS